MTEIRLSEEQLAQVIQSLKQSIPSPPPPGASSVPMIPDPSEHCRFNPQEAKSIHGLADLMNNGGLDNFRALLDFGRTLSQIKKWSLAAVVSVVIGGLLYAIWQGIMAAISGEWRSPWSS